MNEFLNVDFDDSFETQETDSLGGFTPLASDVYTAVIKEAYFGIASTGTKHVTLELAVSIDGSGATRDVRKTIYYTNKEGSVKNKDGTGYSYGYNQLDALCLLATGKGFREQQAKEVTLEIYNQEAKGKIPTDVVALISLCDKEVQVGIKEIIQNKQVKDTVTGKYIDTPEKRHYNDVDKFFYKDGRTFTECQKNLAAEFKAKWLVAFKDKPQDTYKDGVAGATGISGAPSSSSASGSAASSGLSIFATKTS